MTYEAVSWLLLGAYAIHILEEFALDWRGWAQSVLKLPVDWPTFYVTNSGVVVLGFVAAQTANTLPVFGLSFAALMLINATFFHVLPFIVFRGRFSPGLITAVVLFYPAAALAYIVAADARLISGGMVATSLVIGAVLMAYPIVLLHLKGRPYFKQS
ncbi:HXXEE domain-containing protein [Microvirga sp. GCM10011540]|uniref:HXXEE domain-containing protein n=1 Tax=Microvirga sp. GCM10011540 TaxID=3317338 RepID=UPI00361C2FD0